MIKDIMSKKEITLTKEDVKKELEKIQLQNAKNRAKIMAGACVGMGAIKITQIATPTVIATYSTGKAIFLGTTSFLGLALPNTAFMLGGLLLFSAGYSQYKVEHKKIKDEQAKNPDTSNLYNLGECKTTENKETKTNTESTQPKSKIINLFKDNKKNENNDTFKL